MMPKSKPCCRVRNASPGVGSTPAEKTAGLPAEPANQQGLDDRPRLPRVAGDEHSWARGQGGDDHAQLEQ